MKNNSNPSQARAGSEAELQEQVAEYLRRQYPSVIFHSDFGSGTKLTAGQAVRQKRMNGGWRGYPDLFIAKPVYGSATFYGLFLELKKEGTRLKKKNGDWATPHIAEQAEMLEILNIEGYWADFAIGFDEAKKLIDNYLGGWRGGSWEN